MSVADAFDAMTSERSYRAALAYDDAVNELIRGKGTQFDPEVVGIFVSLGRETLRCNARGQASKNGLY